MTLASSLIVLASVWLGGGLDDRTPDPHPYDPTTIRPWVGLVVFSPLIENALLLLIFRIAWLSRSPVFSILFSSACLAALHGIVDWIWALSSWPPFVVIAWTIWEHRGHYRTAYLLSTAVHATHNLIVLVLLSFMLSTAGPA